MIFWYLQYLNVVELKYKQALVSRFCLVRFLLPVLPVFGCFSEFFLVLREKKNLHSVVILVLLMFYFWLRCTEIWTEKEGPLLNLKDRFHLKNGLFLAGNSIKFLEGGEIFFIGLLSVAWSGDCWEVNGQSVSADMLWGCEGVTSPFM